MVKRKTHRVIFELENWLHAAEKCWRKCDDIACQQKNKIDSSRHRSWKAYRTPFLSEFSKTTWNSELTTKLNKNKNGACAKQRTCTRRPFLPLNLIHLRFFFLCVHFHLGTCNSFTFNVKPKIGFILSVVRIWVKTNWNISWKSFVYLSICFFSFCSS